jgi:hypothetical protein
MADQILWHFSGDYFENCSCTVVCPCLVSKAAPLTSRPTEGVCNVPLIFHIDSGRYGNVALDGLNVVAVMKLIAGQRRLRYRGDSSAAAPRLPPLHRPT